jgi:tetratricopeptide (TPR) repeat protein
VSALAQPRVHVGAARLCLLALLLGCGPPTADDAVHDHAPAGPTPIAAQSGLPADPYQRALALERAGNLPDALESAHVAAIETSHPNARLLAAKLAIQVDDHPRAIAHLDALLQADPENARALYNRGVIAQRQGDYNVARTSYLGALGSDPSMADARYNLALLTWTNRVTDEARHHVAKFKEGWPADPRVAKLEAMLEPATPTE